jgi:hypothetical protein
VHKARPVGALEPVGQLRERDPLALVPPDEDSDGREAHVEARDDVSRDEPGGEDGLVAVSRGLGHGVRVWGIEAQRSRGRP